MTQDSPFCQTLPKLQWAWDSVSLGLLKTCPRKYELAMLEGWSGNPSPPQQFGILIHRMLEHFDKLVAKGTDRETAILQTVRYLLIQAKVHLPEGDTARTPLTLARTFVWYTEEYRNDVLQTVQLADGRGALELSFRIALPMQTPDGTNYVLCGHMDKLARYGGMPKPYVLDRKHTKYQLDQKYFAKYSPDHQMSGYSFAADVILQDGTEGVLIDAIQVGVNFTRFARGFAPRTDDQKEEWVQDLLFWLRMAEDFAQQNYWPMNDTACHHYNGCQFRGVCGRSPSVRSMWLNEGMTQKAPEERWNPLVNRDD